MDSYAFIGIDEAVIRQEREKARRLRKSRWWQNKLAACTCYYCQGHFKPRELTMDHLQPLARGGSSSKGNLVTACKACNNKKKNLLPYEWEEYMAEVGRKQRTEDRGQGRD